MGRLEDLKWMGDAEYAEKYSPSGTLIVFMAIGLLVFLATTIILILI